MNYEEARKIIASANAKKRWAKTTKKERSAYGKMMVKAREEKKALRDNQKEA